jgi:hypothetical protein
MNWTRPSALIAQVQKLWDRGELLAPLVTGESLFPKCLTLKAPTSAEIADHFDDVRVWIGELRAMSFCRVEMREFRHRIFGANAVPQAIWIDTARDALALIGKQRAATRFAGLVEVTQKLEPRLLSWLVKRPLQALELAEEWCRLLEIVGWIEKHPASGMYLRQVDIPGVHTKFIEAHRGVLSELLDIVLAPEAIDLTATGVNRFAKRYGFRDKPVLVRFRPLDLQGSILPCGFAQDISLDAESFVRLDPEVSRVFITENEINFLVFPQMKESLVIFGCGYGFEMLSEATWLKRCRIHYWGDIDTHGFAILDQLRSHFDHVESFLMDRATLLAFESQWGVEEKQTLRDLTRLDHEEKALYDDLRDNRIRKHLRLEQEKIGFGWVESMLSALR